MEMNILVAEMRDKFGTGASRELRRKGMVPAIVYGSGKKELAISIQEKEIKKLCKKLNFTSNVIQLDIEGKKHKVLPKAVEFNPINDFVRHVDFLFLGTKTQKVDVPIIFEGKDKSLGIKRGGYFNTILRSLTLICPSDSIPEGLIVDVANIKIGTSIRAGDIAIPAGCKLVTRPELAVASIIGKSGKSDEEEQAAAPAASA